MKVKAKVSICEQIKCAFWGEFSISESWGEDSNLKNVPDGVCESFKKMEAPGGFEPPVEILQTSALPLGDGAPL